MKIGPYEADRAGIWFPYRGDTVIWIWPWRRGKLKGRPWISLGFTGNGEFGDARFASLAEIERQWEDYSKSFENMPECSGFPFGEEEGRG